MKKRKIIILIAVAVVIGIISFLVLNNGNVSDDEKQKVAEYLLLETPIGKLYYPEKWREVVNVEMIEMDQGYVAEVFGDIDDKDVLLYTLYFGVENVEAFHFGNVNGISVLYNIENLDVHNMTDIEQEKIYEMQMEINYILDQISKMSGYAKEELFSNDDIGEKEKNKEEVFMLIDTPIGKLYYPKQWCEKVRAEGAYFEDNYIVEVVGDTNSESIVLFTLYIGSVDENVFYIGSVNGLDVGFKMNNYNLSNWSENEKSNILDMQNGINNIIEQIVSMQGFYMEEKDISETKDNANSGNVKEASNESVLDTPVGKLKVDADEKLTFEILEVIEGYSVSVYGQINRGQLKLYTVYMDTEEEGEIFIGHINDVKISYEMEKIDINDWSKEEKEEILEMQFTINHIIDQIRDIPGYKENDLISSNEDVLKDYVLLDTMIGKFYYPGQWNGIVKAEELQTEVGYTAEVYGEIESGRVLIFTLYIGIEADGSFCIGYVNDLSVRFKMGDTDVSSLSQEEQTKVNDMQMGINDIIEQICELQGFRDEINNNVTGEFKLLDTPLGEIYYPGRWEGKVITDPLSVDQGYAVAVYGQTKSGLMKLFTIYIGSDVSAGTYIGAVNEKAIWVSMTKPVMNDWAEEDRKVIVSMQEDVSYIYEQIYSMSGYVKE